VSSLTSAKSYHSKQAGLGTAPKEAIMTVGKPSQFGPPLLIVGNLIAGPTMPPGGSSSRPSASTPRSSLSPDSHQAASVGGELSVGRSTDG
jgi:hypothetical protein